MIILLSDCRCGGNILKASLNQHPMIRIHPHEVFIKNFHEFQTNHLSPLQVFKVLRRDVVNKGYNGFHLQRYQLPLNKYTWTKVLTLPGAKVINLKRQNILAQYKSWMVAEYTKEWMGRADTIPPIVWDEDDFQRRKQHWVESREFIDKILRNRENQIDFIDINYESLERNFTDTTERIQYFLDFPVMELKEAYPKPKKVDYSKVFFKETELITDMPIVTACNNKYIQGAYLLAWSVYRQHKVEILCYDLGIDEDHPIKEKMIKLGVKFIPYKNPIPEEVYNRETWVKPYIIQDALKTFPKVLWLDADVVITKSLLPIVRATYRNMFIPEHGFYSPTTNENPKIVHEFLGYPKKKWYANKYPCACVLGMDRDRDTELLNEWIHRIDKLTTNLKVMNQVAFYDQGVLQDILDVEPEDFPDGKVWNNLHVDRYINLDRLIDNLTTSYYQSAILHFGGINKPWHRWNRNFDLGEPI